MLADCEFVSKVSILGLTFQMGIMGYSNSWSAFCSPYALALADQLQRNGLLGT